MMASSPSAAAVVVTREEARARLLKYYAVNDVVCELFTASIEEDVIAIVVDGKRYPVVGPDEIRMPEILSTRLALHEFGVEPYYDNVDHTNHCYVEAASVSDAELSARATLMRATNGVSEEHHRSAIIADVLNIVFRDKRYPPRADKVRRFPEDLSVPLARLHFGVDAYDPVVSVEQLTII